MNVNFHAPRRVGSGKLPNDALPGKKNHSRAAGGWEFSPTDALPSFAESRERELAFVPPWGRGEMKKHFCAAGPFSQDSGPGAPEKHGVGRSYKRARWEPAWGRLGSPRFPAEFPRKLRMGNRRSKMGLAQRFLMQFHRFGTNENFCKNDSKF